MSPALLLFLVVPGLPQATEGLRLSPSAEQVGKYQRIELLVDLARPATYANPFDPDEVRVDVLLKSPGKRRLEIPAFFYQPYECRRLPRGGRDAMWIYPTGKPVWKARFTPAEVGVYEAVARLKDRQGQAMSPSVRFECRHSPSKGYLRASRRDPRFLEFSEGQPFFAIGQNLAFVGESQYVTPAKIEAIFDRLAAGGANYLRIWTCSEDWAMALEARKSAWTRSWGGKPPWAPLPDATAEAPRQCVKLSGVGGASLPVSPSHTVALRPETRYRLSARAWCEGGASASIELNGRRLPSPSSGGRWAPVEHTFLTGPKEFWLDRMAIRLHGAGTIYLDGLSLREQAGGPELLWEADPNRPIFGHYNPTDSMMLDELIQAAESRNLYLQLCFMTRDQYMRLLKRPDSPEYQEAIAHGRKLIRYLVARWGYSTSVGAWEYFNELDPGLPIQRFYDALGRYLEETDVYGHLRTTSAWAPSPRDYRHPKIDIAQPHFYLRPTDRKKIHDEVRAVLERAAFVRTHTPQKPAMLGEFGLADDQWRATEDMKKDRDYVHFHNALWASALSGLSGTALFWWWEDIDAKLAYRHYRPLARWLADIPFTTAGLSPHSASLSGDKVRLVGLQGRQEAFFWMLNPAATWADHLAPDAPLPELRDLTLSIRALAAGRYRLEWYDPWEGKPRETAAATVSGEVLQVPVPSFTRDLALKIRRVAD